MAGLRSATLERRAKLPHGLVGLWGLLASLRLVEGAFSNKAAAYAEESVCIGYRAFGRHNPNLMKPLSSQQCRRSTAQREG